MSRFKNQILPELHKLENTLKRPMVLVETGTIRNANEQYHSGDGWSTLYLAEFVKNSKYNHIFYSVDLITDVAKQVLTQKGLMVYVNLVQSPSTAWLSTINFQVDFAYLDSANNAQLTLDEFKTIRPKMIGGGVVAIDDVDLTSQELQKGKLVIPYAKTNGYPIKMLNRQAIIHIP